MGVARACGRETWRAGVAVAPYGDTPVPHAGRAPAARRRSAGAGMRRGGRLGRDDGGKAPAAATECSMSRDW